MHSLVSLVQLAIVVLLIASWWKIFEKAGKPGWAAVVPFYNIYIFLEIAKKPGWWLILCLIPLVNIVIGILATIALAERFGKSGGYVVGMVLLPFVFYPLLAFGDEQYRG